MAEVKPPNVAIISSRITNKSANEIAAELKKMKGMRDLPILFLVEQNESENTTLSDQYCSEYLIRPFTPNELMTIIRSLLRQSKPIFQDKIIKYNDIRVDLSNYRVYRNQKQFYLGPTEFKILQLLSQQPKKIYSRRQIIDYVCGTEKDIAHRTIDVHINRIRTLMKLETDQYPLIKTIRSAGYCLD